MATFYWLYPRDRIYFMVSSVTVFWYSKNRIRRLNIVEIVKIHKFVCEYFILSRLQIIL